MPIHFGSDGQADGFAQKSLFYIFLLPAINAGSYFLIKLLVQLDPKTMEKEGGVSLHLDKILLSVTLLLSVVSFFVFQSMFDGSITVGTGKLIPIAVALFISMMGNCMNNLKPNYFIGFHTPWTWKMKRYGAKRTTGR